MECQGWMETKEIHARQESNNVMPHTQPGGMYDVPIYTIHLSTHSPTHMIVSWDKWCKQNITGEE